MHFSTWGVVGLLALAAAGQPASAADIPLRASAVHASAVHSWAGIYLGGHAGYGRARAEITDIQDYSFADASFPGFKYAFNHRGFLGGMQAGYQVQSGAAVVGVEIDVAFSGLKTAFINPVRANPSGESFAAKIDWFSTARLRFGYAIDHFLPFVSIGAAAVSVVNRFNDPLDNSFSVVSGVKWGFAGGGGIEYMIDDRWSVRGEYLYLRLLRESGNFNDGFGCCLFDWNNDLHVGRVAVNYRFPTAKQPATAATLPVKAPAARAPALHLWAGPYAGVHVGYGSARTEIVDVDDYSISAAPVTFPGLKFWFDHGGILGGGQIGYLAQSGVLVYGGELDIAFSGMKTAFMNPMQIPPPNESFAAKVDWFSTARVRLGYAIDRFLPFGSIGVAAVKLENRYNDPVDNTFSIVSGVKWGWAGGGGLEYALDSRWSVRGEYLYVRLKKQSADAFDGFNTFRFDWKNELHIGRFALNYRM